MNKTFTVTRTVTEDAIDNNNHMHDAYYNIIFSEVINKFNEVHGLSWSERDRLQYTVFTVETHTTFLHELTLGQESNIELFLYNYDDKRTHFFLRMLIDNQEVVATNEVMMLGIDRTQRRAAPFPKHYLNAIQDYAHKQEKIEWPPQLGHSIGIPYKGE